MLDTEAYTTFPNTENSSREQPPGQRTSAFSFLMSRPLVKHVIAMGTAPWLLADTGSSSSSSRQTPKQRAGIQAAAMVVEGAARTWERRRIRRRLLENRSPCVPTTPARRPAEILHPSDTQELAPSRSGGDAPAAANRAKPRIDVQPGPGWWVRYEDRQAGSDKRETPTSRLRDPHARAGRPGLYT